MTLQEWVLEQGGQRACAAKHGISAASLGSWCRFTRYPGSDNQQMLIKCSANRVDMYELLKNFMAKKKQKSNQTRAVRRLPGSLCVRDLERLKLVFTELDLSAERCNLHGERITSRWSLTNVTVHEVRSAVSVLEKEGKDAGNVELIHKTIGAARSAALGRLGQ